MNSKHYSRRILLCATGLSPQIVTETLYALAVQADFLPDEIHLITTYEGAKRAQISLLDQEEGHFYVLCREYRDHGLSAEKIRFNDDTIHIIHNQDGQLLDDIRSPLDNQTAADMITALVRRLSTEPNSTIHASIAGGRKTMGFYLGYAMSLFGRPQDRLSHVLVAPPFESLGEFYYPPRKPRRLELPRENCYVHTSEATVTLADIPFVRLRGHLDDALLGAGASYSETVRRAQQSVGPPELVLDPSSRQIRCGDTVIQLKPVDFAFYAWFARRTRQSLGGVCRTNVTTEEKDAYLNEYRTIVGEYSGNYQRTETALKESMDHDYFDQRRSDLHKALRDTLGRVAAQPYLIACDHQRPRSRYALGLTAKQIKFQPMEDSQ